MRSKDVLSGFLWRFAERFGAQLVSMVVAVVLARALTPDDYGIIAIMNVFINILGFLVDGGFGLALIQKKDADELDFSTIFFFNIFSAVVLYVLLYFFAPLISTFYDNPLITPMIRVLGVSLLISGVKSVQVAYVSKKMIFKKFFFATLGGTIGASVIGIVMALKGFGAWAIIAETLFNNCVDTIILFITVKWHPIMKFSFKRFKIMAKFGVRMFFAGLTEKIYDNLRSIIIGKVYTSSDLAFYTKGKSWPSLIVSNVNTSIDSVLLPTFSKEQDNKARLKAMSEKAIKISTFVLTPFLVGLAACSTPLVRLVLTEKWLPIIPYQTIFCVTMIFYPVITANENVVKALGESKVHLKVTVLKKTFGLIALGIAVPISVLAIGYSLLVICLADIIIQTNESRKLIGYGFFEQIKDILPNLIISLVMYFSVYSVTYFGLPDFATLLIQVPLGIVIYVALAWLFKIEAFSVCMNLIKEYVPKLKKG